MLPGGLPDQQPCVPLVMLNATCHLPNGLKPRRHRHPIPRECLFQRLMPTEPQAAPISYSPPPRNLASTVPNHLAARFCNAASTLSEK